MADQEKAAPKSPKKIVLIGAVAGALVVGIVAGAMVLGPMMSGGGASASPDGVEADGDGHGSGDHGGAHSGGGHGEILEIERVILNPAGSEGIHFLLVSVTFAIPDKEKLQYLRDNKHIVRDQVMNTLSKETLETLSKANARERVKGELAEDVGSMIGGSKYLRVYLPEFVVQ